MMRGRRHRDRAPRLEMMPLIDVVFLLLVVFIFSMLTMVRSYVIPVELPRLSTGEVRDLASILVISVEPDGSLSLGGESVSTTDLLHSIEQRHAADPDLQVLINADRDARHGDVALVLDLVRAAGVGTVLLVAEPDDDKRSF